MTPSPYDVMVNRILPELVTRFRSKSSDYGDVFKELGLAGQYSDMHRKMHKLKKSMWEGKELKGEQADEILCDLFGNVLISLYLIYVGEADQRAAGPQSRSGQDPDAQRAAVVEEAGRAWQQEGDEIR